MIEYKFKGLDRNDGCVKDVERIDFKNELVLFSGEDGWVDFNNAELIQNTGLTDKNGKEIYTGYIVRIPDNGTYSDGVVFYSDKYASFVFRNTNSIKFEDENIGDYDGLEVIGNIYENPNLLQEEQ